MSTTRAESASLAAEVFPLDAHEREALSKAAGWAALAGITHLLRTAIGPGLYPDWYVFLTALAYGLMLPVIADMTTLALPRRIALGLWMLALAAVLWRSRREA